MANVNEAVKAVDPNTNYYGQQKLAIGAMEQRLSKAFDNGHANLMNEGEEEVSKDGQIEAMKRRLGLVK